MNQLPNDPIILLSYLNTQLRDFYPSLDELCLSLHLCREELEQKMTAIDYRYDEKHNQFV